MKFSVVIAAFNSSETMSRTLLSIKNQTLKPHEVIIVDDASEDSDKLAGVIRDYLNDGLSIRYKRHEENLNGAAARNKGIEMATGEFIAFIDADDEWLPNKLELYAEQIKKHGSHALYFSQVAMVQDGKQTGVRPFSAPTLKEHISEYLFLTGGFIQTSTIVLSAELAKGIRFDERFVRHQDYDFCLRVASHGLSFQFIKQPLTRYHIEGKIFKSKNESYKYCHWWVNEMKSYMSIQGYYAYKFFLISGRLYCERKFWDLLLNASYSALRLGFKGVWKSRRKVAFILRGLV